MKEIKDFKEVGLGEVSSTSLGIGEPECPHFHRGNYNVDDDDHFCPTPDNRKYKCCRKCDKRF